MNILLLTSHAIAEYDDLRMLTDLGYDVFSIGGAYDEVPFEGKRPPLPGLWTDYALAERDRLISLCHQQRADMAQQYGDPGPAIDWAKGHIHDDIIDWADVIIVHHFPERWIGDQWDRIKHKRVIWRTCGQSDPRLEEKMAPFHRDGMQIVRYSPAERRAFQPMGMWAGEDALIRFGKYPDDYGPWVGDRASVGNITQDMARRGEACGLDRWNRITEGMPVEPAGPGSEALRGGIGGLTYEVMLSYLRHIRAYFYTGTQPASYTLGLIEAMLSGVPVVAQSWVTPSLDYEWLGKLWEGTWIVGMEGFSQTDHLIRDRLNLYLRDRDYAAKAGEEQRERAVALFGIETVGQQWREFLR